MKLTSNTSRLETQVTGGADNIRMTAAMKDGLDALQREYDAFRESAFQTLALINDRRIALK